MWKVNFSLSSSVLSHSYICTVGLESFILLYIAKGLQFSNLMASHLQRTYSDQYCRIKVWNELNHLSPLEIISLLGLLSNLLSSFSTGRRRDNTKEKAKEPSRVETVNEMKMFDDRFLKISAIMSIVVNVPYFSKSNTAIFSLSQNALLFLS